MPTGSCIKKDCTFATTGVCLELYAPVTTCPNFRSSVVSLTDAETELEADALPLPAEDSTEDAVRPTTLTKVRRRFHPGTELGLDDAAELMRGRYVHVIGVLGQSDAGKTAFLSSLYLMASRGWLKPSYSFAGSLTLQGFEDRARGLRKWEKGRLAERFMLHTQLGDSRRPSFMHLALRELKDRERHIELLLTDLPGEWTSRLITNADTASRFEFLKRADGIIYVIDGRLLIDSGRRHVEIHKAKILLSRLLQSPLMTAEAPLVLLVSKCDEIGMDVPPAAEQIMGEAAAIGLEPNLIMSASFSRSTPEVQSGTGIMESISRILNHELPSSTEFEGGIYEAANGRLFGKIPRR